MSKEGCFTIIVILLVIGGIMTCTNKCKSASAVREYNKGNFLEALSKFEKTNESDMGAIELFYYSKLCETNDQTKSENLKIKSYNKLVTSDKEVLKFKEALGSDTYDELMEFGTQIVIQQSLEKNEANAFAAAKVSIQNIANDPNSIEIQYKSIAASQIIDDKGYYLVKLRVSGTNAFGGIVSNWYVVETIIDINGNSYTRKNIQSFNSEPTDYQIELCKSIFGW